MLLDAVKSLRTALLADSLLVNGDGVSIAGIGSKLHWAMVVRNSVDNGIDYPFCIISHNSGGAANRYRTRMGDLYFVVKAVALGDAEQAAYLGNRIYEALHEATLTDLGDWQVWRCQMEGKIHYSSIEAEIETWHDGGIFRLRMSK